MNIKPILKYSLTGLAYIALVLISALSAVFWLLDIILGSTQSPNAETNNEYAARLNNERLRDLNR